MGWLRCRTEREKILRERDGESRPTSRRPGSSLRICCRLRSVWGLFLTQGCEVYGGYMLLTWLPSYLQQAKGLSVMNAGHLTAIPFGAARGVRHRSRRSATSAAEPAAVQCGRRRSMIAVMLAGAWTCWRCRNRPVVGDHADAGGRGRWAWPAAR